MSVGHAQKKWFIDMEIYQKSSYGSDVPSETYPPPPFPSSRNIWNLLKPPPILARDVIHGWPLYAFVLRKQHIDWELE